MTDTEAIANGVMEMLKAINHESVYNLTTGPEIAIIFIEPNPHQGRCLSITFNGDYIELCDYKNPTDIILDYENPDMIDKIITFVAKTL